MSLDAIPGKSRLSAVAITKEQPLPETIWNQPRRSAPPLDAQKEERKALAKAKEEKLGKWFDLPKQTLTPELEKELKALKLRAYMDPKRFYKANDSDQLPTHFHIGTLQGGLSSQPSRKRGRSLLDEALSDDAIQAWTQKKEYEVAERNAPDQRFSKAGKKGRRKIKARR